MSDILRNLGKESFDRRAFVKGVAATTASVAVLSAAGCSPENRVDETQKGEQGDYVWSVDATLREAEANGTWVPAACWHNCGGRCVNKALVYDGVVVRQKTDDVYADEEEGHFQNRSCPRGRSHQQLVFGADRLKYPMKRKGWQPGGGENVNGQLRGIDEWERISWDEALDMAASEIRRIYDTYGPRAAFQASYGSSYTSSIMASLGGYVDTEQADSYGSWMMCPRVFGSTLVNYNPDVELINDRFDMVNAETIVMYGANPGWASAGSPLYHYLKAKEAGVEFVYVGPSRNVSAAALEARWIPVRPGTDTAFLLAVAHEMIEKGYYDQEFLNAYTVGFDADHMPADAVLDENFKDYVLGAYDGTPKTPAWAEEITGAPAADIAWFAEKVSKDHKVMLHHSYPSGRCNGAENLPQLFMTIGAMGGHMGKSGHATGSMYNYEAANGGPRLIRVGRIPSGYVANPLDDIVSGPVQWKSIVDGHYTHVGKNTMVSMNLWAPAEERELDIKFIWAANNNELQARMDVNMGIEAFRKVEFVLAANYIPSLTCQYADIVLPVVTRWEGNHSVWMPTWINRESQVFNFPVVEEPLYEAKPDEVYCKELAERLGLDTQALYPLDYDKQWIATLATFEVFAGGKLKSEYTTSQVEGAEEEDPAVWEKLVTITEEDLEKYNWPEGTPQEGRVTIDELRQTGVYQVERSAGDDMGWIGYKDFVDDPEKNPRPTASGKLEIYCQKKADLLNQIGINEVPLTPYPSYIVPVNGYEASFDDWEAKVKGAYPFQMYTPHYLRRSHTSLDNLPWLKEAFANPAFVNASDAAEKGIQTGDTILITSPAGKILRKASVLESVMPGCIAVPHGAHTLMDEETGIDMGGNENTLTGSNTSNYYPQSNGANTVLVNYEKYSGPEIPFDYEVVHTIEESA